MKSLPLFLAALLLSGCATYQPPDCVDLTNEKIADWQARGYKDCGYLWVKPGWATVGHAYGWVIEKDGKVKYWDCRKPDVYVGRPRFIKWRGKGRDEG